MSKNMVKMMIAVFIITLFAWVPYSAYASGAAEDPIKVAKQLIKEERLGEAMILLGQLTREDSDTIVEAEALMRKIRKIYTDYNVSLEIFIDHLNNNPEQLERTLEIIAMLKEINHPSPTVQQQLELAELLAYVAFDSYRVGQIMDQAYSLLEQAKYDEALDLYLSINDIHREQFEQKEYQEALVENVDSIIREYRTKTNNFTLEYPAYQLQSQTFITSGEEDIFKLHESFLLDFLPVLTEILQEIALLEALPKEMRLLSEDIQAEFPDTPVEWYLNFQQTMALGRVESYDKEGLLYAMRQAYRSLIMPYVETLSALGKRNLLRGYIALDEKNYGEALPLYQYASDVSIRWEQAAGVMYALLDTSISSASIAEIIREEDVQNLFSARSHYLVSDFLAALAEEVFVAYTDNADLGTEQNNVLDSPEISSENNEASRVEDRESIIELLQLQKNAFNQAVGAMMRAQDAWLPLYTELLELVQEENSSVLKRGKRYADALIGETQLREGILLTDVSQTRTEEVPADLEAIEEILVKHDVLADAGIAPSSESVELSVEELLQVSQFFEESPEEYQIALENLNRSFVLVKIALNEILNDEEYLQDLIPVQDEIQRLRALIDEIKATGVPLDDDIETLDTFLETIAVLRTEGYDKIDDARQALENSDLSLAEAAWEDAQDAFLDALSLQEDSVLREDADRLITAVGDEIRELRNRVVVAEVRELLTEAKDSYNRDAFASARDKALNAQELWETAYITENPEIESILQRITSALALQESGKLFLNDPLYPVLSNYLSLAENDFQEGVLRYRRGDIDRGDILFDRAIENIENIREVRPLNWESRIIELRIVQIRDEDTFDEYFALRYQQAVARIQTDGPLQAYSDLIVLQGIKPNYPGMKEQIFNLEVTLNLRPNPVDEARLAEANNLLFRAEQLASSNNRDNVVVSVSLLEQVIALNPENEDAKFLLDSLRIRLGGEVTTALSTEDEALYRRAETLFTQGSILQALSIVNELLQNADNRNYPPLIDLQRRINLRLGV